MEHKLGIYVSEVETGSEAHLQGLQVGDQILKICGMPVQNSTHKEVVSVILSRTKIQLKAYCVIKNVAHITYFPKYLPLFRFHVSIKNCSSPT